MTTDTVTVNAIVEARPAQVTGVSLIPGADQLQVHWNALTGPTTYNTRYKVQWKSGSESYDASRQVTVSGTIHTIPSLTAGTEYTVRVIATDPKAPTADGPASD